MLTFEYVDGGMKGFLFGVVYAILSIKFLGMKGHIYAVIFWIISMTAISIYVKIKYPEFTQNQKERK